MAYTRQVFIDNQTVLSSLHLKNIENGILDNETEITKNKADINVVKKDITSITTNINSINTSIENLGKSVADGKSLLASSISPYESVASTATFEQLNTAMKRVFTSQYSKGYTTGSSEGHSVGYDEGYEVGYEEGVNKNPPSTIKDIFTAYSFDCTELTPQTTTTREVFNALEEDFPFDTNFMVIIKLGVEYNNQSVVFSNLGFGETGRKEFSDNSGNKLRFYAEGTDILQDIKVDYISGYSSGDFTGSLTAYCITWDNPINYEEYSSAYIVS